MLRRDDCPYQPYYCEENIWKLCKQINSPESKVIFITNHQNAFIMKNQIGAKLSPEMGPIPFIIWDYHVILMTRENESWIIYDPNSSLDWRISLSAYIKYSFYDDAPASFKPSFRLIEGDDYLKNFSSDRRHMKNDCGNWLKAPPEWPLINPHLNHNLDRYIDFSDTAIGGKIIDLHTLKTMDN